MSETGYCIGCLRTTDEISIWRELSQDEKNDIASDLGRRRANFPETSFVSDQMKRIFPYPKKIDKIISLVPSLTQTLYDFGLGEKLCGVTRFCPKNEHSPKNQKFIGGTKNLRMELIEELSPDIIFANKEENPREEIEKLAKKFPVWVSNVSTLDDSLLMLAKMGEILNCSQKAEALIQDIQRNFSLIHQAESKKSCAYLIWKDPYMIPGGDTYIQSCLEWLGFDNVFKELQRYPEISLSDIRDKNPEYLFLPDEPFIFKDKDLEEMTSLFPETKIKLVKGKYFSWYGSLMLEASDYFKEQILS